jgi:transposase
LGKENFKEGKMARPKEIIDQELVLEAKKQLKKFEQRRIYLRLLAIIRAGEYPITEVAKFFEVSRDTVSRWIKRFRAGGVEGLEDKLKGHNPSKLKEEHKKQIASWLETGKNAGGEPVHWTLEKLRLEIEREFGVTISIMPLWSHLRMMGFRQKVPRPVHAKADRQAQEAFKKNC